jgi:hypothetical protein
LFLAALSAAGRFVSHEGVCVLNTGDADAHVHLTLFFQDREPMDRFHAVCPARRANHIRMDKILDDGGSPVPQGTPYSTMVESDVPVVVQYTRLDATQANEALMTTYRYRSTDGPFRLGILQLEVSDGRQDEKPDAHRHLLYGAGNAHEDPLFAPSPDRMRAGLRSFPRYLRSPCRRRRRHRQR